MSKHSQVRRSILLIEKIQSGTYPNQSDILHFLEDNDIYIKDRTFQRDLKHIREEFGLNIEYSKLQQGYFINDEDSVSSDTFSKFLELMSTAEELSNSISEYNKTLQFISFDNGGTLTGLKNLPLFLRAIRERRYLRFTHTNYQNDTEKQYTIAPYLLRLYQNRWYLIGKIESGKYRTFGIDRIQMPALLARNFKPNPKEDPKMLFENMIGVIYGWHDYQKVVISFHPSQAPYLKSLKIHSSQHILVDNYKEFRIELFLHPNFELSQQILKYGSWATVLEPQWLVDEMKEQIKNMLQNYSRYDKI